MKKLPLLLAVSTLSFSAVAEETSWFDSLKSFVGLGDKTEQTAEVEAAAMPSANGLVDMLSSSLNVNSEQASGGIGAILNYVKNNVSAEQFGELAKSLPGVDGVISQMPDLSQLSSETSEGIGGLLDQASQYSDSLKSINDVKKQFEALGLKPEMISDFVTGAQSYLDSEQGQKAKQVITDGLGKLLG
jgi:hypothetical protein